MRPSTPGNSIDWISFSGCSGSAITGADKTIVMRMDRCRRLMSEPFLRDVLQRPLDGTDLGPLPIVRRLNAGLRIQHGFEGFGQVDRLALGPEVNEEIPRLLTHHVVVDGDEMEPGLAQ